MSKKPSPILYRKLIYECSMVLDYLDIKFLIIKLIIVDTSLILMVILNPNQCIDKNYRLAVFKKV